MTDDHETGFLHRNVTRITALEQSTIEALWAELTPSLHRHDAYGPMGCPSCRHLEAERVAERFPPQ